MSKRNKNTNTAEQAQGTGPEEQKPQEGQAGEKKARYTFPRAGECPRCRANDTIATSTQGKYQYRVCRRAVCRHRYVVEGTKI